MFNHPEKKPRLAKIKPLHDLIITNTASVLLTETKRQVLVDKIKSACGFDSTRFNQLCMQLIHNTAEQYQSLPETAYSYYSLPGGLLDHALNRTEAAVHLFRHCVAQGSESDLTEEQQQWLYALFSASILQGIGKLQLDYKVSLFDISGRLLKIWNPVLEDLANSCRYYQYEFLRGSEDDLRKRLNLLLAYRLMPESGFAWIAKNPEVLATWLALLHEDKQSAGMLGAILERADAIAIHRDMSEFLVKHGHTGGARQGRIGTFIDTVPETMLIKEQLVGVEFIKWLTEALDKKIFSINKLPLLVIPAGLIVSRETIEFFMRDHPEIKNWKIVQKGLLAWDLHAKNEQGEPISRLENPSSNKPLEGIILEKYTVTLPAEVALYNANTGKSATVSAMELPYQLDEPNHPLLSQLALTGDWQEIELSKPFLESRLIPRE